MKIHSRRIVLPSGVTEATIEVEGGRIAAISRSHIPGAIDVGESAILPGLVDSHVHVNDPGRAEWEGFETATRAAAAGGITTIVDMPLNSIPATTTVEALQKKSMSAVGRCHVDYAFWGGVIPGNAPEIPNMGVPGFKCFLVPSGVDEFPHVTERDLQTAMPLLAKSGAVLLVHAELDVHAPGASACYHDYLDSRPPSSEVRAIAMMARLARQTGCRVHIVHLSAADALPLFAGAPMSAETCPHYLTFDAEGIPDGATEYKCAPPIRARENRERLWKGLADGTIGMVVSDHSPCTPSLKPPGDFSRAWGGIASLQFALPAVWTEASRRGYTLPNLVEWMCRAPARLAGLDRRKGTLAVGHDADFVVLSPEATFRVESSKILHRHAVTPYLDRTLRGVVEATYLRGSRVDGLHPTGRPCL